jgi:hypothetical protein
MFGDQQENREVLLLQQIRNQLLHQRTSGDKEMFGDQQETKEVLLFQQNRDTAAPDQRTSGD